ncbi:replication protein P [Candidatus Sororendozoicomonas aggregata]|uniref:replication protein P n=1 Tax=Candidatus Sororendozoicomonas aggregata TaxID=3073239 RepID=UPI002ED3C909
MWLTALKDLRPKQIELGIVRVKASGSDWPPSVVGFLEYCKVQPEDLGWPAISDAWEEVNLRCTSPQSHEWSHPSVSVAGRATGWYEIAHCDQFNVGQVKQKFAEEYRRVARDVFNGLDLSPQKLLEDNSSNLERGGDDMLKKIMDIQGIDTAMSGAEARKRLKGMV